MNNLSAFLQYLSEKNKKQSYIDMSGELPGDFYKRLDGAPPSAEFIDAFVRSRWSGYVSRDKTAYQILNDYADFCETEIPVFACAFRDHVRKTFEGEAKKAMRAYKKALVYIRPIRKLTAFFSAG